LSQSEDFSKLQTRLILSSHSLGGEDFIFCLASLPSGKAGLLRLQTVLASGEFAETIPPGSDHENPQIRHHQPTKFLPAPWPIEIHV
jgi:hypothetical protein